ncbi:MAG: response regulator transcription factor [Flavobacterium sp.]
MNILLLEDDFTLSQEVKQFLEKHQFHCDCIYEGALVAKQSNLKKYDLYILDISVPTINGLEVCKLVRQEDKKVPIIMLTAFGEIEDKVVAFNNGADDYLVKPFHFEELLARIKSLLRRKETPQQEDDIINFGEFSLNISELQLYKGSELIDLTPKEFKLLSILAKANGRVLSKQQIADELWDYHIETSKNTIEVYINFLRKKLEKDSESKLICTKIGYGYYLNSEKS